MELREDIDDFLKEIPKNVSLVAATKYVDATLMRNLYKHNVKDFGENRVEAFLEKYDALQDLDITWHFIGHLQSNKAKQVINKIDYLHSLDSLELAKIINEKREKPLKCFVEVSINNEATKNGVKVCDVVPFIKALLNYKNIEVIGLMMMSIKYSSHTELLNQFIKLKNLKDEINKELNINLQFLSMGMSDDYKEAISCGATHIRLGRILWKN